MNALFSFDQINFSAHSSSGYSVGHVLDRVIYISYYIILQYIYYL